MNGRIVTTVACAALALTGAAQAAAPKGGTLKVDFKYTGKSPAYKTALDGVPLRCTQYWGPGHLYVVCTLAVVAEVKKSGPAA